MPVFSPGGPCEQFWHEQGRPLFVHPAFLLPTTASPTLQGVPKDGFGEAVVWRVTCPNHASFRLLKNRCPIKLADVDETDTMANFFVLFLLTPSQLCRSYQGEYDVCQKRELLPLNAAAHQEGQTSAGISLPTCQRSGSTRSPLRCVRLDSGFSQTHLSNNHGQTADELLSS